MDRMEALAKAHRVRAVADRIAGRRSLDSEALALLTELGINADGFRLQIVNRLDRVARELERDPATHLLPGGEENPW